MNMDHKSRTELKDAYKNRKITGGVYNVRNTVSGRMLVMSTTDLHGAVNRYAFARQMGGCFHPKLQKDLEQYGKDVFAFETLEELDKRADQTDAEFAADIKTLEEMWMEKLDPTALY